MMQNCPLKKARVLVDIEFKFCSIKLSSSDLIVGVVIRNVTPCHSMYKSIYFQTDGFVGS